MRSKGAELQDDQRRRGGGVAAACDIEVLRNNFATLSLYDLLG
jgi:hypothetical protein